MQYGGGGFNGTLVTGLGPALDASPGTPTPLARGYVTFGTDSGHQAASLPEPQALALNDEALENFAYALYKKLRDVAVEIVNARYGRRPSRVYYMGSSEGEREGLTMAQMCRFPGYPRYRGNGDPHMASSFACETR
jgi:feruloyl esterase